MSPPVAWLVTAADGLGRLPPERANAERYAARVHGVVEPLFRGSPGRTRRDARRPARRAAQPECTSLPARHPRGEGTADDAGYGRCFGGSMFADFSDHPRRVITAGRYTSTAAGVYQFLSRTWDGLVGEYGFADFSPQSQDEAAVALSSPAARLCPTALRPDRTGHRQSARANGPACPAALRPAHAQHAAGARHRRGGRGAAARA